MAKKFRNLDLAVLIVGLGSIGRRHAQVVKTVTPDEVVFALRRNNEQSDTPCEYVDQQVYDLESALSQGVETAIIANPAPYHINVAKKLVEAGVHILIEKPVSTELIGIASLHTLAKNKNITVHVGYNLRFDPGLLAIKKALENKVLGKALSIQVSVGQNLAQWRPNIDTETSVSAQQSLGGGVVFELSHELDYARWLMGDIDELQAMTAQLGSLVNDVEDMASIQCKFSTGAIGHMYMDMLSHEAHRECRIVCENGILEWNGITGASRLYSGIDQKWQDLYRPETFDRNISFQAQWVHFMKLVNNKQTPVCSLEDGAETLKWCLAAKRSAETGERQYG